MKYIYFFLLLTAQAFQTAQSSELQNPIFSCTTETKKNIAIYKNGTTFTYSFGQSNQLPELTLTKSISNVKISINDLSGNELSNSISFPNGTYTYIVKSTINRVQDTQTPKHGVLIKKNSKYLSYIACTPDSEQGSLLDLE
ncbi:hypothetical protein [Pseudomonas sp. GD03944]|uniref:hypothetical protein n=1 Tax=Pseudomonas sp. GD03944 TaxID=2975409 RepID=UPI00244C59DC|nr:hypothetical protein [Pseudomonas sp. GD03944]MDH1263846.1 hypothetical protein [Pseudomonas sp. GD03944]